jgi:effector-binding domain-containing protein
MSSADPAGLPIMSTPVIEERPAQPYVAVRGVVTMQTFPQIADRLGEVFGWLGARGVAPAGAPFFRYLRIDMQGELEIEAGVPVAAPVAADGELTAGVLPAGRYATIKHVGHPDALIGHTAALLSWGRARGLRWDCTDSERGELWGCRLEIMHTDPRVEPDLNRWTTELAFKLGG